MTEDYASQQMIAAIHEAKRTRGLTDAQLYDALCALDRVHRLYENGDTRTAQKVRTRAQKAITLIQELRELLNP